MAAAALIAHRRAPGRAALRPIKTRCRTQSRSGRTPHGADLRSSDHHSCCPCLDLLPRCLAWRAASLCRRQLTRVAERHPELVSDIRPKFPEDVETHACCEGIATCPRGGSKTAFVPRMLPAGPATATAAYAAAGSRVATAAGLVITGGRLAGA